VSVGASNVLLVTTQFRFASSLWAHHASGGWHFVTLPTAVADELRDVVPPAGSGFGSIRVTITVGASTWDTSVFPDKTTGSFVLPVKRDVRRTNQLVAGDTVQVLLRAQQPAEADGVAWRRP
jgi:hypothetical protein